MTVTGWLVFLEGGWLHIGEWSGDSEAGRGRETGDWQAAGRLAEGEAFSPAVWAEEEVTGGRGLGGVSVCWRLGGLNWEGRGSPSTCLASWECSVTWVIPYPTPAPPLPFQLEADFPALAHSPEKENRLSLKRKANYSVYSNVDIVWRLTDRQAGGRQSGRQGEAQAGRAN